MKRVVVVVLFVLGACSGSGWPESEKVAFMDNCERTSGGQSDKCACLLEHVENRYPDIDDADQLSISEMSQFVSEC